MLIYLLIIKQSRGVYTPQDADRVSAVEIMQYINTALNLKKKTNSFLGMFMYLAFFLPLVVKGYGGVSYSIDESHHDELDYLIVSCKEGIKSTVLYGAKCNNSDI